MNSAATTDEPTAEFDAQELARGWQTAARQRPQKHAIISWGARTDTGRTRENNEDKFDFFLPDDPTALARKGRLWAVADGMGGHNAGQIASEATLKSTIRAYFTGPGDDTAAGLRRALEAANGLIHQAAQQFPDQGGMGTTATVAVVREDELTLAHVGDSRAYLLREGQMRQLTQDHSWVEEQVRLGGLTRAEAEASPYRNVITRSIGMGDGVVVDIITETLQPGDVILLCSDGLTGYLDAPALASRLFSGASPSAAALALIDAANDAGGRDNITAVVMAVRDIVPFDSPGDEKDSDDAEEAPE